MADDKLINQESEGNPKDFARRGVLKQLVVVGGATLVFSPQVLAQGADRKVSDRKGRRRLIRDNEQTARDMEALIAEATPYILVNDDGTLELQPESSPTLEVQQLVQATMAELNPKVQVGEMLIAEDLNIHPTGISIQANARGVTYYWWGRRWALNNTDTQRLIAILQVGGAIAVLFPGAGRVVAFVLGLGAGVIQWYAAPGTGIYIYEPWVGGLWIASQPR